MINGHNDMEQNKNNFLIPISIIMAGALIAGALIFIKSKEINVRIEFKYLPKYFGVVVKR